MQTMYYDMLFFSEIKERSGAKLSIQISKQRGKKTFAIRGTRSQIQKALEMLTTRTGIKVCSFFAIN